MRPCNLIWNNSFCNTEATLLIRCWRWRWPDVECVQFPASFLFSLHAEPAPRHLRDHLSLRHYKSPIALLDMHLLTCGNSFLLHSVNLILFTLNLVHFILHISPNHSPCIHSYHLSLLKPFNSGLKLSCSTNLFLSLFGLPSLVTSVGTRV